MEKLTQQWHQKHGKVANGHQDDGLARMMELVGNIKQKVEGMGQNENGPKPSEVPAYIRKQKQPGQDLAQKSIDQKNKDSGAKVWSSPRLPKESFELESIMKLAGLAK